METQVFHIGCAVEHCPRTRHACQSAMLCNVVICNWGWHSNSPSKLLSGATRWAQQQQARQGDTQVSQHSNSPSSCSGQQPSGFDSNRHTQVRPTGTAQQQPKQVAQGSLQMRQVQPSDESILCWLSKLILMISWAADKMLVRHHQP